MPAAIGSAPPRIIGGVRYLLVAALAGGLALAACQSSAFSNSTVVSNGQAVILARTSRTPAILLESAGVEANVDSSVLNNGIEVAIDQPIPLGVAIHMQVIRPTPVLINGKPVLTTARTVGEVVRDQGFEIYAADILDPPAEEELIPGLIISFEPGSAQHGRSRRNDPAAALLGRIDWRGFGGRRNSDGGDGRGASVRGTAHWGWLGDAPYASHRIPDTGAANDPV